MAIKNTIGNGGEPAMPRELPDGCAREIAVSSRLNSFSAQPQGYDWKYGPREPTGYAAPGGRRKKGYIM